MELTNANGDKILIIKNSIMEYRLISPKYLYNKIANKFVLNKTTSVMVKFHLN